MKMETILDNILNIQQQYPNIYVGGSVALILQNVIPFRKPSDVDLITLERMHIYDLFNIHKEKNKLIRRHRHDNIIFEIFYNPNAEYVKYTYKNNNIKLSPVDEIMSWKINQLHKHPEKDKLNKHKLDLQQIQK
jgi:hypothetical protein